MPDWLSTHLMAVTGDLIRGALVCVAYLTARTATERRGTYWTIGSALGWCAGVALLAAIVIGQGSCTDGEPMFGYCDDGIGGYAPAISARVGAFVHVFLLLFVPVVVGAFNDRARLKHLGRRASGK